MLHVKSTALGNAPDRKPDHLFLQIRILHFPVVTFGAAFSDLLSVVPPAQVLFGFL